MKRFLLLVGVFAALLLAFENWQSRSMIIHENLRNDQVSSALSGQLGAFLSQEMVLIGTEKPATNSGVAALHFLQSGDLQASRQSAIRCLAKNFDDDSCQSTLINGFLRFGEFTAAYPYVLDCVNRAPENSVCLNALVSILAVLEEPKAAMLVVERLVLIDSDNLLTHVNLAKFYETFGKIELARNHLEIACDLGQENACQRVD